MIQSLVSVNSLSSLDSWIFNLTSGISEWEKKKQRKKQKGAKLDGDVLDH